MAGVARMRLTAVLVGLLGVFAVYCSVSEYREREAKAFCDSFRPFLARHHAENGRYPESLPRERYPASSPPGLIRPDFYLAFSDGQGFLLRFVNPLRPPFENVVAFQSDIGHWVSWDGY